MHLNRYPPSRFLLSRSEEGQLALQSRMSRPARPGDELVHDDLVDGREEGVTLGRGFDLVGLGLRKSYELRAETGHAEISSIERGCPP
jgi:hypothetical protein